MNNPGKGRRAGWLLLGLLVLTAGCNREDPERLARVGRRRRSVGNRFAGSG